MKQAKQKEYQEYLANKKTSNNKSPNTQKQNVRDSNSFENRKSVTKDERTSKNKNGIESAEYQENYEQRYSVSNSQHSSNVVWMWRKQDKNLVMSIWTKFNYDSYLFNYNATYPPKNATANVAQARSGDTETMRRSIEGNPGHHTLHLSIDNQGQKRGFMGAITNMNSNKTEDDLVKERERKEVYRRELEQQKREKEAREQAEKQRIRDLELAVPIITLGIANVNIGY